MMKQEKYPGDCRYRPPRIAPEKPWLYCSSIVPDPPNAPGQVADEDDIVDGADDPVRELEALVVLEFEELVVDLAYDSDSIFLESTSMTTSSTSPMYMPLSV